MPDRHHRKANAAQPRPQSKRAAAKRTDWITGTLVELDVEQRRVTIRVREGRGARIRPGAEHTIDVGEAMVKAGDGDGDGRPGITDLFPGDELHIELAPKSDGPRRTALRITQRSPSGPIGGLRRLWHGWRS